MSLSDEINLIKPANNGTAFLLDGVESIFCSFCFWGVGNSQFLNASSAGDYSALIDCTNKKLYFYKIVSGKNTVPPLITANSGHLISDFLGTTTPWYLDNCFYFSSDVGGVPKINYGYVALSNTGSVVFTDCGAGPMILGGKTSSIFCSFCHEGVGPFKFPNASLAGDCSALIDCENKRLYFYQDNSGRTSIPSLVTDKVKSGHLISDFLGSNTNWYLDNCFYFSPDPSGVPKINYGYVALSNTGSVVFTDCGAGPMTLGGKTSSIFCSLCFQGVGGYSPFPNVSSVGDYSALIDCTNKKLYFYNLHSGGPTIAPLLVKVNSSNLIFDFLGANKFWYLDNCFYFSPGSNGIPKINYGSVKMTTGATNSDVTIKFKYFNEKWI